MDLRKKLNIATLVFPVKDDQVLLGIKVRKIGAGCWNGWGGAQEERETVRQAARREFEKESGLIAEIEDLEYVGKVTFNNLKNGISFKVLVHVFILRKWQGELKPRLAEMKDPRFWSIKSLPFDQMMPSDRDWLPFVFHASSKGKFFEAEVFHTEDQKDIREKTRINLFDHPPTIT